MKSVMNHSLSSSRRVGLRQRFGSSMSSAELECGSGHRLGARRGVRSRVREVSVRCRWRVSVSVFVHGEPTRSPKSRLMEGIVFKDVSDFGDALARHAFVAADNEDEFFGLHPP